MSLRGRRRGRCGRRRGRPVLTEARTGDRFMAREAAKSNQTHPPHTHPKKKEIGFEVRIVRTIHDICMRRRHGSYSCGVDQGQGLHVFRCTGLKCLWNQAAIYINWIHQPCLRWLMLYCAYVSYNARGPGPGPWNNVFLRAYRIVSYGSYVSIHGTYVGS